MLQIRTQINKLNLTFLVAAYYFKWTKSILHLSILLSSLKKFNETSNWFMMHNGNTILSNEIWYVKYKNISMINE